MRRKQMLAVINILVTLGFACFPADAGEIEDWVQSNPDFHITAETYSNAPYWLMPTNIPYRLLPVENGKWIWTTNMNVPYYDAPGTPLPSAMKWLQLQLQDKRRMDETDPPGIANVPEYCLTLIRDFNASMWLMFKPDGGHKVPLSRIDWYWNGTAVQSGNTWSLTRANKNSDPAGVNTESYPAWTNNVSNFRP